MKQQPHSVGAEMINNRFQGEQFSRLQDLILRKGSEFYFDKLKMNLSFFKIEGYSVLAETQADADEIYKRAIE